MQCVPLSKGSSVKKDASFTLCLIIVHKWPISFTRFAFREGVVIVVYNFNCASQQFYIFKLGSRGKAIKLHTILWVCLSCNFERWPFLNIFSGRLWIWKFDYIIILTVYFSELIFLCIFQHWKLQWFLKCFVLFSLYCSFFVS